MIELPCERNHPRSGRTDLCPLPFIRGTMKIKSALWERSSIRSEDIISRPEGNKRSSYLMSEIVLDPSGLLLSLYRSEGNGRSSCLMSEIFRVRQDGSMPLILNVQRIYEDKSRLVGEDLRGSCRTIIADPKEPKSRACWTREIFRIPTGLQHFKVANLPPVQKSIKYKHFKMKGTKNG